MELVDAFALSTLCPVKAQNAGLFIARGTAMHPTRVIESHELIFVKQGELNMWEEDQTFHLQAGQSLHLWPGRQHGSSSPMELGLRFYWIHFEVGERESKDERNLGDRFAPTIKVPQMSRITQPERLEGLFLNFLRDQESGLLHPYSANLLTMLMLVEVAQSVEDASTQYEAMNVIAARAHTYIRMNYNRPITTTKL